MSSIFYNLGDLVRIRTGKLDANANDPAGLFPFFTCAKEPLRINTHSYDCECVLVAGNGDLNVKYYNGKFDAYQRTYIIESLNSEVLDVPYLYHFMSSYLDRLRHMSIGGVIKYIKIGNLTEAQIPLPPVSEQRRITAVLDKASAVRAKRRQALAHLDTLARSVFIEMFGDPLVNPKNWKLGTIKDALLDGWLLGLQDGNHGEIHPKASDFSNKGVPFVMANCLVDGELDIEKAYKLDESWLRKLRVGFAQPNDLLISHKGTVGELAIVPESCKNAILSPQTTYYRPSHKLNVRFLMGFFGTRWFQTILGKEAIQSTRAYIGITRQKSLPMMFPPLELQNQYAAQIEIISRIRRKHLDAVRVLDTLCASLQHRAFRGEL